MLDKDSRLNFCFIFTLRLAWTCITPCVEIPKANTSSSIFTKCYKVLCFVCAILSSLREWNMKTLQWKCIRVEVSAQRAEKLPVFSFGYFNCEKLSDMLCLWTFHNWIFQYYFTLHKKLTEKSWYQIGFVWRTVCPVCCIGDARLLLWSRVNLQLIELILSKSAIFSPYRRIWVSCVIAQLGQLWMHRRVKPNPCPLRAEIGQTLPSLSATFNLGEYRFCQVGKLNWVSFGYV